MKIKILTQRYGNGVAIGFSGDKKEIERHGNFFYNYKITNSDPIWMCDNFAYIITTDALLLKGMIAKALVSLIGTKFSKRIIYKGKRISILPKLAQEKAERQISEFVSQTFLNESEIREYTP